MNAPAPYCPETVNRIRGLAKSAIDAAIANELGWTSQRVRDTARRHGIELAIASPSDVEMGTSRIDRATRTHRDIQWTAQHGLINLNGAVATLAGNDRMIFDYLFRVMHSSPDDRVTGKDLADFASVQRACVVTSKRRINQDIKPLALAIDARSGGGYRLVDLAEGDGDAA